MSEGRKTPVPPGDQKKARLPEDTAPIRVSGRDLVQRSYLIVIEGERAGEMHRIDPSSAMWLGCAEDAHIRIHDDGVTERHCRVEVVDDKIQITHAGGAVQMFINGEAVETHTLADGDKIHIANTVLLKFAASDADDDTFRNNLLEAARRDGLTGAVTKTHLISILSRETAYANRHESPLTVLLVGIDDFAAINDNYGHKTGDDVLVQLAQLVMRSIRAEDVFARYDGDKFVLLSRGITKDDAKRFAERIRSTVDDTHFGRVSENVTVSVGLAMHEVGCDAESLMQLAEEHLSSAKSQGKNRVAY